MVRAVILAPWRGGDRYREASWEMVRPYYERTGLELFVADSGSDPFSTAQSYNRAAEAAGDWDIGIFINTDCVIPLDQLWAGVRHAERSQRLTLPHNRTYLLKRRYTPRPDELVPERARYHLVDGVARKSPAGVVIIPRSVWERVNGYDEKFLVWGFEDKAMLQAVRDFDRQRGPIFHYWHPIRRDRRDAETYAHWRETYWGKVAVEHLV